MSKWCDEKEIEKELNSPAKPNWFYWMTYIEKRIKQTPRKFTPESGVKKESKQPHHIHWLNYKES